MGFAHGETGEFGADKSIRERNGSCGRDIIYGKFSLITRISVNRSYRSSDNVLNSVAHQSWTWRNSRSRDHGGSIARRRYRWKRTRLFRYCFPSMFENNAVKKERKWILMTTRGATADSNTELWWTWMQSEQSGRAISQKKKKERLKWLRYKRFLGARSNLIRIFVGDFSFINNWSH